MANVRIVNNQSQAFAQNGTSHAQNTVSASAENVIDFTLSAGTTHVKVQFTGADARVTFDGSAPTATKGFIYTNGTGDYWSRNMAVAAKAIRKDATDVVVEIQELNYQ